MIVTLLTEHHLEFLSLKGGCRGLSESTLVKMSHCWISHMSWCNYIFLITGRDDVEFHTLDVVVVQFGNNSMRPCFGILAYMESA